jgi:hypothetical protein
MQYKEWVEDLNEIEKIENDDNGNQILDKININQLDYKI